MHEWMFVNANCHLDGFPNDAIIFFSSKKQINLNNFVHFPAQMSVSSASSPPARVLSGSTLPYSIFHAQPSCLSFSYVISRFGATLRSSLNVTRSFFTPGRAMDFLQWQLHNKLLFREQVMAAITPVTRPSLSFCLAVSLQLQLWS